MHEGMRKAMELSYGQALWYAWGYLDNGQGIGPTLKAKLDPWEFAEIVKENTRKFEARESRFNESIQRQWERYMNNKYE